MLEKRFQNSLVHKKYTYKNGKKYGPYYYENRREGDKIVTTYLGTKPPKKRRRTDSSDWKYLKLIIVLLLIVFLGVFFVMKHSDFGILFSPAEVSSLELSKSVFEVGDFVEGEFIFRIFEGELIPADSEIVVSFGDEEERVFLDEIFVEENLEGNYYLEGVGDFGSGLGFGLIGEKEEFPELSFELEIFRESSGGSSVDVGREEIEGIIVDEGPEISEGLVESGEDLESVSEGFEVSDSGISEAEISEVGELESSDISSIEAESSDDVSASVQDSGEESSGEDSDSGEMSSETSSDSSSGESSSESSSSESSSESSESSESSSDSGDSGGDSGSSDSGGDSGGDSSSSDGGGDVAMSPALVVKGSVSGENYFEMDLDEGDSVRFVSGSVRIGEEILEDSAVSLSVEDGKVVVSTDYSIVEAGFGEDYLGSEFSEFIVSLSDFDLEIFGNEELFVKVVYGENVLFDESAEVSVEEVVEEIIEEFVISDNVVQKKARLGEEVCFIEEKEILDEGSVVFEIPLDGEIKNVLRVFADEIVEEKIEFSPEKSVGKSFDDFEISSSGEEKISVEYCTTPVAISKESVLENKVVLEVSGSPYVHYKDVELSYEVPEKFLDNVDALKVYWVEEDEFVDFEFDGEKIIWFADLSTQTFEIIIRDAPYVPNITKELNFSYLSVDTSSAPYNDILSYYNFDGDSGAKSYDFTRNNLDGTNYGGVRAGSEGCIYGDCLQLDGVNDYVLLSGSRVRPELDDFSIGAWIKTSDSGTIIGACDTRSYCDSTTGTYFLEVTAGGKIRYSVSEWGGVTSSASVDNSEWHYITLTFDEGASNVSVYIDGAIDNSAITYDDDSEDSWQPHLGVLVEGDFEQNYFEGSIDEVMFFDSTLSSAQISAIYSNSSARFKSSGEMLFANFGDISGDEFIDLRIEDCETLFSTSIEGKINDGDYETFSNCRYEGYSLSGISGLESANFTLRLNSDSNNFYTPIVFTDLSLVSSTGTDPPSVEFGGSTPEDGSSSSGSIPVSLISSNNEGDHYSFVDFDKSLLLWMMFNDIDESGNPLDSSVHGNDGTKYADAKRVNEGYWGRGFEFDGAGDHVQITGSSNLEFDSSKDYTWSFWIYPTGSGGFYGIMENIDQGAGFHIVYDASSDKLGFTNDEYGVCPSSQCIFGSISVPSNVWTFVTYTYSDGLVRGYVNGQLDVSDSLSFYGTSGDAINLGASSYSGANIYFEGKLDEFLFFNRTLDSSEILSLYNSTANQYSHDFTDLSEGTHTFTGYAVNVHGDWAQTEERNIEFVDFVEINTCRVLDQPNTQYVLTEDLTAPLYDACITISADNVTFDGQGHLISNLGTYSEIVRAEDVDSIVIRNLDVYGGRWGFYLQRVNKSLVENSDFNRTYSSSFYLIYSNDNVLRNLTFNEGISASSAAGIYISNSDNNFVKDIYVNDFSQGALVSYSEGNILEDLNTTLCSYGVLLSHDFNTTVRDSTFSSAAYGIESNTGSEEIFENLSFVGGTYLDLRFRYTEGNITLRNIENIGPYSFDQPFFLSVEEEEGSIRFLEEVSGSGDNLAEDIYVENNLFRVLSDENVGFNESALITLRNNPFEGQDDLFIQKDDSRCSDCYNFTSLNAETVVFNVSSWTDYKIERGFELTSCGVLDQPNTYYVLSNDLHSSGANCLTISADNITLDGEGHLISNDFGNSYAISAEDVDNLIIRNLNISKFERGINLRRVSNSLIKSVFSEGYYRYGIYVYEDSINNTIRDVKAGDCNYFSCIGIYIGPGSDNNYLENIMAYNANNGFSSNSADNLVIKNFTSLDCSTGIFLAFSTNISINNISLINSTNEGIHSRQNNHEIYKNIISNSANNLDIKFLLTSGNVTFNGINYIGSYSFDNDLFLNIEDAEGSIEFLEKVRGSGDNFTRDISIENNLFSVLSDENVGFNKSALITLKNNPFEGKYDLFIGREGRKCDEVTVPSCHNFTALDEETVVFNVSSWTEYSISSGIQMTSCRILDEAATYYLMKDLYDIEGTCFEIIGDGIILEGNGYSIEGETTGMGVYAHDVEDITVSNLGINKFHDGVSFSNVSNSFVSNVHVNESTIVGFLLLQKSYNNSFFDVSADYAIFSGIYSSPGSDNNLFEKVDVNDNFVHGISFESSKNNIFKDIEARRNGIGLNFYNQTNLTVVDASIRDSLDIGIFSQLGDGEHYEDVISLGSENEEDLFFDDTVGNITLKDVGPIGDYFFVDEFYLTVEDSLDGSIEFLEKVKGFGNSWGSVLQIGNNLVAIDSQLDNGFNKSALITLKNNPYVGQEDLILRRDNVLCNESTVPSCYNLTALDEETVVFNVSSWTEYRVGLRNEPPVITLISPGYDATITNRTPLFSWVGNDGDNDPLEYEFNLSCYSTPGDNPCPSGNEFISVPDGPFVSGDWQNLVLDNELEYFIDEGYYYLWSVRAHDSNGYGEWVTRRFDLASLVEINLINSDVSFSNLAQEGSNDTSDNSPFPFIIENAGNVYLNVSLNITPLWDSVSLGNIYYQYKADESTISDFSGENLNEPNSFDFAESKTDWMNVMSYPHDDLENVIVGLNYSDANDLAELDIKIQAPSGEPAGSKESLVMFIAKLGGYN